MLERFSTEARTQRSPSAAVWGLRMAALGAFLLAGICAPGSANAAAPAGCAALQAKYPDLKGKSLVNAINPHTPGYEAIDPKDPNKYVGFDIDLGEKIGECLGFTLTYKAVTFAALLTTLSSGQADIVISDIYATEERAKAADFITYSTACWSPRAIQRRSPASTPRCAVRPRPRTPASSKFRWCRR
jgi:polar amino acid transport system substrate-binding protein